MTIRTERPARSPMGPVERRPRERPTARTRPSVRRALAAAIGLVGLATGVPALLVSLGRALPIDVTSLGIGALAQPDDGSLVLVALLAIAWSAWSVVILSIGLEMWSAARRTPTPRIPGLGAPQRLAAALVASLALGLATGVATGMATGMATGTATGMGTGGAGPGEQGGESVALGGPMSGDRASLAALVLATQVPGTSDAPSAGLAEQGTGHRDPTSRVPSRGTPTPGTLDPGTSGTGEAASDGRDLPTITTQRHDTLWLLAEQLLGNGARYTEIVALNAGVPQADGRSLAANGRIYPDWTLRLPADADLRGGRPGRPRGGPGDTRWGIADERLGDPHRYPELFAANAGDRQPDGRRLVDPDLIHPGWVLEIPGEGLADPGAAGPGEPVGPQLDPSAPEPVSPEPEPSAPAPDARGMGALDRALPGSDATLEPDATVLPARPSEPARSLDRVPGATESAPPAGPAPAGPTPAGPTPAASDSPPRADRPSPESGAVADASQAAYLVPAGGTVAALLLAGLIRELARRRRQFQRHRRPGERMRAPAAGARALELLAADALADEGPELLDRALAQLAAEAHARGVPLPRVRTVRVSEAMVHLDLAADTQGAALAPFIAGSDRLWELDPTLLTASPGHEQVEGARDADDLDRPFPGLVTVGVTGAETVLVDTEEIGTLRISGPPDAVPAVLRAMASELALGPARETTSRTLHLTELALSEAIVAAMEAGELAVENDPARVTGILAAAQRRGSAGSRAERADPVELVLADRALGVEVVGRSGAALITTDSACPAGAVLELDGRGGGVLQPEGLALVPQVLGASAAAALSAALAATHLPPDSAADLSDDLGADPDHGTFGDPPSGPSSAAPAEPGARIAPRVLLLGELMVEDAHGRAESTRIGRLAETTAFVLLNPGARPSALQSALWPGRRSNPQTCRQMISRTRTWLGRTADGEPYLMPFTDTQGRLQLRPEVGSDWSEFQRLAAAGLADPDDVELLETALTLVRGRPFGPVAAREMPWADLAVNDMICLITDVAHELATRHERAGRTDAARRAALIGLRTESESEVLAGIVARTSAGA